MPEHAHRFTAPPYDQFEDGDEVADWGADELFTRMPRPRAVDDAPAPRFNRSPRATAAPATRAPLTSAPPLPVAPAPATPRPLVLVEAPEDRRVAPLVEQRRGPRERRRAGQAAAEGAVTPAERAGLSLVDPGPVSAYRWDETGAMIEPDRGGRKTSVITGRPEGVPRPLPITRSERRPGRTPAEWIATRPERIVAWAFVLGLILILIAISTADAATL